MTQLCVLIATELPIKLKLETLKNGSENREKN